jgi:glucose/arabinose dehydrogenase
VNAGTRVGRAFRRLGRYKSDLMRWTVLFGLLAVARVEAAPQAPQGFEVRDVVTRLSQPTAIAFTPSGTLFIAEKRGRLRLWARSGGLRTEPVIEIPTCTQSEMGLLGVAVDPEYVSNGYVYLYHTQPPGGDPTRCGSAVGRENRVVRVTVANERGSDLIVLLDGIRTDNGNHDGGGLRFGPDGYLYVGVGDTGRGDAGAPGQATNPYAQDLQSLNGKLLRITRTGAPAPGNPFLGDGGNARFVFAYGLRNPFRFGIQPGTGLVWLGDVGQGTFEEIDVAAGGENFGWPQCEGLEPAEVCPGNSTPPVHVYRPGADGASVTGGVFYGGSAFGSAFVGNYFFGDFVLDRIWRAVPQRDPIGFAAPPEVFVRDAGSPVDFAVAPDGTLYYVAFTAEVVRRVLPQTGTSVDCARALGEPTAAWTRQLDQSTRRCLKRDDADCFPPSGFEPRVSPRLARRIARRCGSAPPPELCARLACAPCAATPDLIHCAGDVVTEFLAGMQRAVVEADDGRCGRALARVVARAGAGRLAAYQRCRVQQRSPCNPPSLGPDLARKLARACNDPSAAVCDAVACSACGNGAALADCTGTALGAAVDSVAFALDGGG